jgi:hypothetical protein
MNNGAIKAEVAAHFDPQASTSGRVQTWVNEMYAEIVSRGPWSWTERIAALDAVAGQMHYSIIGNTSIPDLSSILDVTWTGPNPGDLERIEQRTFDRLITRSRSFTVTSGSTASGAATVNVGSTAGFPSAGFAFINPWIVTYTGTTATTLTGVSGVGGTVAANTPVHSTVPAVAPVLYTIGGGLPEATSGAAAAGGVQRISIYPAPATSVAGGIQIRHNRAALDLSADADVPIIPARYHSVLIQLAIARGRRSMDEDDRRFAQVVDTRIADMQRDDARMRGADPNEIAEKPHAAA